MVDPRMIARRPVLLLTLLLGCEDGGQSGEDGDHQTCSVGTEGCACTSGGACDPGLQCRSQVCVAPADDGGDGTSNGSASDASGSGDDVTTGGGGASGDETTGSGSPGTTSSDGDMTSGAGTTTGASTSGATGTRPESGMWAQCSEQDTSPCIMAGDYPSCFITDRPNGYCTGRCAPGEDPSVCDPTWGGTAITTCIKFNGTETNTLCALDCTNGKTCPPGMQCTPVALALGPASICS